MNKLRKLQLLVIAAWTGMFLIGTAFLSALVIICIFLLRVLGNQFHLLFS